MGLTIRKSFSVSRAFHINISKRGLSTSVHAGPFTLNTTGRTSTRLVPGVQYRTYPKRYLKKSAR